MSYFLFYPFVFSHKVSYFYMNPNKTNCNKEPFLIVINSEIQGSYLASETLCGLSITYTPSYIFLFGEYSQETNRHYVDITNIC